MYDLLRLDQAPVRAAAHKVAYGQTMKFATLNTRSIRKAGMHKQVERYMKERDIAVLCLQETKVAETTQYVVGDLTYVLHGHGGDNVEHGGVGFVIRKDVRPIITGFQLDEVGRIMTVGLDFAPRMITLVTAYMPHNSRTDLERAEMFEALEAVIANAAKKGPVLVLGDLNARIHGRLEGEEEILGPHTWGLGIGRLARPGDLYTELTNRELLMYVCESQSMKVMNTWFDKPPQKKVTYLSPGVTQLPGPGQPWNPMEYAELDLCLIQDRWKSMIKDVQSATWASLNTDHFPLEVEVQLKLSGKRKPNQGAAQPRYNFQGLDENTQAAFDAKVREKLRAEGPQDTVDGHWKAFCGAVQGAMAEVIPKAPKKAKRPWITADTMELIEHRKCLAELGLVGDARSLDKLIRERARVDKQKWIEEGLKIKFWDPIKSLTGKPNRQAVAMKKVGDNGTEWGKPSEVFADYLEQEQWGRPAAPEETEQPTETGEDQPEGATDQEVPQPEAPQPQQGTMTERASGSGQQKLWRGEARPEIEQGEFSLEEMNKAIRALANNKATGADGIPNEAWKLLGEARQELLDFMNRCWREERFPEDWRLSEVVAIFKKGSSSDPANYRPISLLQTAYKIMGKMLVKRLEAGLEGCVKDTQYGFRRGKSTAEPLFILRRLQDLVHAKKNHALHLIFLDWSKAFDKVDTRRLPEVLTRMGVPDKVVRVVKAFIEGPEFLVRMGTGDKSSKKKQDTGIRQGCTLSPFLFTLILTAIMQDVEAKVRAEHPMATTPAMPVMDLEYADDTALIAKTAEIATKLLQYTEEEAARYGLHVNRTKTFRLAYNSKEEVRFADGMAVPKVEVLKYLGTLMSDVGSTEHELKSRTRKALARCRALRPIWAASNLTTRQSLRVLNSCVFSALLYGLQTLYLPEGLERGLDALQVRCIRRALGIRSTYASKIIGEPPTTNQEVAHMAGAKPLSAELTKMRYQLLGHVLRREGADPMRAATYDRFGQPKTLAGVNRHGRMRMCWAPEVIESAAQELRNQGTLRPDSYDINGGPGHPYSKVTQLAQDRQAWKAWVDRWYNNQGWWSFRSTAQPGEGRGAVHRSTGRPLSPARSRL